MEPKQLIPFDLNDPFPLLSLGSYTYAMAKNHAIQVDQWLGFETAAIERSLSRPPQDTKEIPQERWIGLDSQSFLTPYVEIRSMLELLGPQPGEQIIDLGCGYARMGHVLGRHYPSVSFLGYELVKERIEEAQKRLAPFSYPRVHVQFRDLAHEKPITAPYYFIYDYGSKAAIEKTLNDLKEISKDQSFQLVARGRATRSFIHQSHAWLSEVNEPRHFETFSIYQS